MCIRDSLCRGPARAGAGAGGVAALPHLPAPRELAHGSYADARLTVPTLLVNGADDPVASRSLVDGWQGHADKMSVEFLQGIGHFVSEEAPEVVAERVRTLFG